MKAKKLFPDLSMKRLWNKLKGIEDKVNEQDEKTPFSFAIDENGNYGYIKEGADSVTPFKKESMIVGAARRDGSPYPQGALYTFTEDYEEINCIVYSYRTSTAAFEEVANTWFENCDSYERISNVGYARHYKLYGIKTGTVINYYGSNDTTYQTFIFFT